MRPSLTLWQRLSVVFALLLLAGWAGSAWLQVRAGEQHEREVVQRLSRGLAQHIASHTALLDRRGFDADAVRELFSMLMVVNPGVEVYLLAADGRIHAHAAPLGHVKRETVALEPVRRLLAGDALPILGDDPRGAASSKPFSAAPLRAGADADGYVYVVLQGEEHDALVAAVAGSSVLRTTLSSMAFIAALVLLAGVVAFGTITRRLRALTAAVQRTEQAGLSAGAQPPGPVAPAAAERDEIALLQHAFDRMAARNADQWRELMQQEQQRRELLTSISHDLRTPLAGLHGYLETLQTKAHRLSDAERQRYLDTAVAQSRQVGTLAQQLFELARLEWGFIEPEPERFSMAELVQDLFQKFELAAQRRSIRLVARMAPGVPAVNADLGMIERVLSNLLDNALAHTPDGGEVCVELRRRGEQVEVEVCDSGPGVAGPLRGELFKRSSLVARAALDRGRGGLGLIVVQSILRLHGSEITLVEQASRGAAFRFSLGTA